MLQIISTLVVGYDISKFKGDNFGQLAKNIVQRLVLNECKIKSSWLSAFCWNLIKYMIIGSPGLVKFQYKGDKERYHILDI